MIGYLVFILFLFIVSFSCRKNRKRQAVSYFFVIAVFSGIRYGFSYDYPMYVEFIRNGYNHSDLIPALLESGARICGGPPFFFIITSVFITCFTVWAIYKASSNISLSIFCYVGLPVFFVQDLSTVRQAMATSVILFLIVLRTQSFFVDLRKKQRIIVTLSLILLAYFCHGAAIVAFLLFCPWNKLKKKTMILFIFLALALGIHIQKLISILINIIGENDRLTRKLVLYATAEMQGFMLIRIMVYIIVFSMLLKYDRLVSLNRNNQTYLNLMCLGLIFNGLFWVNAHLSLRISLFFLGPILIIIPDYLKLLGVNHLLFKFVCVLLFCFSIYMGYQISKLDVDTMFFFYPYTTIFSKEAVF